MRKHTPGPWEARDVSQPWIEILGNPDAEGSREIIGTVRCPYDMGEHRAKAKADARLIASAPALLEFAVKWRAIIGGGARGAEGWAREFDKEARAAIVDATGKE